MYWGDGKNTYSHLGERRLPGNILWACYHKPLSMGELAEELGVACAYLEDEVALLEDHWLLRKVNGKYSTNIVLLGKEYHAEVWAKTRQGYGGIGQRIHDGVTAREGEIRNIGFRGCDAPLPSLLWPMVSIILREAVINRLNDALFATVVPARFATELSNGSHGFVFGAEVVSDPWHPGICTVSDDTGNTMHFMDFGALGGNTHNRFYGNRHRTSVLMRMAMGKPDGLSGADAEYAAELLADGFAIRTDTGLVPSLPVFTPDQYTTLAGMLEPSMVWLMDSIRGLYDLTSNILIQHTPTYLKDQARAIAALELMTGAISSTVGGMVDSGLLRVGPGNTHTSYILLKS